METKAVEASHAPTQNDRSIQKIRKNIEDKVKRKWRDVRLCLLEVGHWGSYLKNAHDSAFGRLTFLECLGS